MNAIDLMVDDRREPVDLEPGRPATLRWRPSADGDGATRRISACHVVVSLRPEAAEAGEGDVWDSGPRLTDGLDGVELEVDMSPSRRYWTAVRLRDDDGVWSDWSRAVTFGTGAGARWEPARPIWLDGRDDAGDAAEDNATGWAFLRGRFILPDKPIAWATLNATGASTAPSRQFVYRMWMNGAFVGCGPVFPTGDETRYDGYDVTGLLAAGENVIGVVAYAMADRRFAAQLDVCFEDSTMLHVGTGPDWRGYDGSLAYPTSPTIGTWAFDAPSEDLQTGLYPFGFADRGFDDAAWTPVAVKRPFARYEATPADPMGVRYVQAESLRPTESGGVVVDFGRGWMGGIRLLLDVAEPLGLTVRFGEQLEPDGTVRYHLSCFNTYEDRWSLMPRANGTPLETWGIRVFRYVELVPDRPMPDLLERLKGSADALRAAVLVQPMSGDGRFVSSDATLNRVWELCRHTIEAFNGNIYVDSWTRERAPYEADAWIQQRAHLALDDAPALGRLTVDHLIANRTWPTEWPFYLILAVHDAWMHTGSLDQARMRYEGLAALLPERYRDEASGLIVKDPGEPSVMDGDLVDWPQSERDGYVFGRVNTVVNAIASQAYADMADMAAALGRPRDAERWRHAAEGIRSALHRYCYDRTIGAYIDGLEDAPAGSYGSYAGSCGSCGSYDGSVKPLRHHSLHASAYVLAFAEPPSDRIAPLGAYLRSRGMACSVYTAAVYLDGLFRAGLGADAVTLLTGTEDMRTWAHMLDVGAGATMEAWDADLKPNTTYSHPWAASPASLLPHGLLGIRPIEPGYRRFAVMPQPGALAAAEAELPTRAGVIGASYRVFGHAPSGSDPRVEGIRIEVTVPPRTEATVVLPPIRAVAPGDGAHVDVDGVPTSVVTERGESRIAGVRCLPGSVVIRRMTAGKHVVIARMGVDASGSEGLRL
ncbi:alpha-L-rhamnosidase-related protein [Bifidobacterium eulemuris]|uniref:alpha-L-rhamnosidase n=1 Tax=Bifidobacterium eulemuris TaxID=1765219 RepID=A0A261G5K6_9BIFI|nr:alpha-L-rhamnosidase C-terminal domain-containing protein [Bifidobacterium eulemuris]OZG66485.1 Bacterial alpha-L-rhamnosidase [Bifidobacterium eulemuris]QOL32581.1 alpha-L-rhamnosidase N-terminal domain-containing protein [Bifidobacterium eulemuris]